MRHTLARVLLLLPVTLTIMPFPEMLLPMYYLAPSLTAVAALYVLALVVSCAQMLYQFWAVGEVERLAPAEWISYVGAWLDRQTLVKVVRLKTGPTLFLLGLIPGTRVAGTTLWRTTGYRWGGYILAAGTAIQIAAIFGSMLGLGRLIRELFR